MDKKWPIVLKNDDGIRPAGKPDECLYCKSKVGEPHAKDCVIVTKIVKVRYSFEIEITVPHHWDKDMIEFHRNESSWCALNAIDDLSEFGNKVESSTDLIMFLISIRKQLRLINRLLLILWIRFKS